MGFWSPSKSPKFDFLLNNPFSRRSHDQSDEAKFESHDQLSPSLVPVPAVQCVVGSIKEKLPVTEFGHSEEEDGDHSTCAVCLKRMSEGDEVRELCNCCHVFHKECLDGWIDQGQLTCPLCRSKLIIMPSDEREASGTKCGGDPWRRERMIYLFGEDFGFR